MVNWRHQQTPWNSGVVLIFQAEVVQILFCPTGNFTAENRAAAERFAHERIDEWYMKHSSLVLAVPALWEKRSDSNSMCPTLVVVFLTGAVMGAAGLGMDNMAPPWVLEAERGYWAAGTEDLFWAKQEERQEKAGWAHRSWRGCAEEKWSCCWVGRSALAQ